MQNILLIFIGKIVALASRVINVGSGSTWPGHIALLLNPSFIKNILHNSRLKTVIIAGTNGKTTTGKLIQTLLEKNHQRVFQNASGANLLNGIASSILLHSTMLSTLHYDYAIFEVDENTLPLVMNEFTPDYLILLNIFRDQLDRYGETDAIVQKWKLAVQSLPSSAKLILNADDPQITSLGKSTKAKTYYFGLDDKNLHQSAYQHAVDATYCPNCRNKLIYKTVYFSHLGEWECKECGNKRPKIDISTSLLYPLSGIYNRYNTNAAVLLAKINNINNETIEKSLKQFTPAFGRQEIIEVEGKKVQLFLSKNPTSFNESLRTIIEQNPKTLLLVLNDRIPDGRDVSWIWDTDTEKLINKKINVIVSGDRAYDIGLRLKYSSSSEFSNSNFQFSMKISNYKFQIEENLKRAINIAIKNTPKSETLYILPTYSAMLEVRKILTGKKIL